MSLVERSMKYPVTVTMVTLASVLFGFVSVSRLSWNLLPEISYPSLTIRTDYPDSAPAEVEKLVTEPLEEAVAVVHGLRTLRSASSSGASEITMEFGWDSDMDYAALDVREKIDLVTLPDDAKTPVLLRFDPNLDPILRIGVHGDEDLVTLRYLAERLLKKELESLDGVASARVRGGLEEEIEVRIDEGKLAALGIPISTVSQFLDSQNVNTSGGSLRDRDAEFLVRTMNAFTGLEEIGQTVLFEEAGRRVRLADVSEITRSFKDREVVLRIGENEAVELAVYKEGNANTVDVARQVKRRLESISDVLPKGVETQVLFDQSTFIEEAVSEVRSNAIFGGLLAIFVLYLFLKDRRGTAVISVIIPLSILATFIVMQQLDVSLNVMSLGGIALGVGSLVDNAIVVLESVGRHRALGKSRWDATLDGSNEVARAVTASTLTTVAVFLPIVFVQGIAGQIFKDQALTVSASQIISLIAALTLIPVFLSLGLRRARDARGVMPGIPTAPAESAATIAASPAARVKVPWGTRHPRWGKAFRTIGSLVSVPARWVSRVLIVLVPGVLLRVVRAGATLLGKTLDLLLRPLQHLFDRGWEALAAWYPNLLLAALRHRGRTWAVAIALAIGAFGLYRTLGLELVPQFSQGEFTFDLELPPGTPLSVTETKVRGLSDALAGDDRIRLLFTSIGESSQLGSARAERRENVAQLNIVTTKPGDRKQERGVIENVRSRIAAAGDIRYQFRRPTYFSFQTPIEVHVYGHDLDALRGYADELTAALTQVPGLRDVESSLEDGNPEVQVSFRRDRLAALDLDIEEVSRTLRNKIRGNVATKYKERDRQLDVLVRTAQAATLDVTQVENIIVSQVEGVPIPLSSVADVGLDRGPVEITRVGQQRAAIIRANLSGTDLGSATRAVRATLGNHPPPGAQTAVLAGQNEEVDVSFRSLLLAAGLAIFMVYLVMACEFESFLHPLIIMCSVPLGLVGAIGALAITRTPVSVVVLIGVILLCGIVVNNAIVLIDFVNQRRREGMDKIGALVDAARTRLRPILMTTLTTVLGLAPMAIGLGEGAEIRAPMAITVIGGLTFATALTLVLIPVVYATVDRRP